MAKKNSGNKKHVKKTETIFQFMDLSMSATITFITHNHYNNRNKNHSNNNNNFSLSDFYDKSTKVYSTILYTCT